MLLTILKVLGATVVGFLLFTLLCFLLYILAVFIVAAYRTIKKEVRKHD